MSDIDELMPIASTVSQAKGWDAFTRALMLAGKDLDLLDVSLRTAQNAVEGCESPVWVSYCSSEQQLKAYSPSKIIRGVLAVLLEKANSLTPTQRAGFDFDTYLKRCQLERYLSQSRGNGIKAVINTLRHFAE
ncbi:SufE family protein [Alteromonas sp. D210916BOD_24]|uniref:SufE family protein n=1 Tax=Alteromonas sp. D210916BOD_24 TaxID=3157618 RepID=UPI00399CE176